MRRYMFIAKRKFDMSPTLCRKLLGLFSGLILCLLLAACGGGGGSGSDTTSAGGSTGGSTGGGTTGGGTTGGGTTSTPGGTISFVAGDTVMYRAALPGLAYANGNVYVADSFDHTIRQITPAGVVTAFAGTAGVAGSADGTGPAASFNNPTALAADAAGNIYVLDYGNLTIRKITPAAVVTTLAGTASVSGRADGTGQAAAFCNPGTMASDAGGTLYVVETQTQTCPSASASAKLTPRNRVGVSPPPQYSIVLRKVSPAGVVTTLPSTGAMTYGAVGIAVDPLSNVFIATTIGLQEISPSGAVTSITLQSPISANAMAADGNGNLYATTSSGTVYKIAPGGGTSPATVSLLADASSGQVSGLTALTGVSSPDPLGDLVGIALDAAGDVFVADTTNDTVNEISPAGAIAILAGTTGVIGHVDGTGTAAQFNFNFDVSTDLSPVSIALDGNGNLFVGNQTNSGGSIARIAPNGGTTFLSGIPRGCSVDQSQGGSVPANVTTELCVPIGIAVDAEGDLFVTNSNANIVEYAANGMAMEIAGTPMELFQTGGPLYAPGPVLLDPSGNLYVGDSGRVLKITQSGTIIVLAGTVSGGPPYGHADGVGTAAQFSIVNGIALDSAGNLYVTDTDNQTIRKIAPDTTVTTIAGMPGVAGTADGTGSAARFNNPWGLAIDAQGNLYIADSGNNTIRKMTPAGVVTTVAGVAGQQGNVLGNLPGGLDTPKALVLFDQQTLAVTTPNAVLKISFSN